MIIPYVSAYCKLSNKSFFYWVFVRLSVSGLCKQTYQDLIKRCWWVYYWMEDNLSRKDVTCIRSMKNIFNTSQYTVNWPLREIEEKVKYCRHYSVVHDILYYIYIYGSWLCKKRLIIKLSPKNRKYVRKTEMPCGDEMAKVTMIICKQR